MFARAYATSIRPISLGRQLIGLLDIASAKGSLSSSYEICLHSDDLAAFADVEQHLVRELIDAATQHCEQSGYQLDAQISVALRADDAIKSGTFQIKTSGKFAVKNPPVETKPSKIQESIVQPEPAPTLAPTQTQTLVTHAEITARAALILATGQRIDLTEDIVKIGRHQSCTIVFADSNVSRVHSQLQRSSTGWLVVDLGSTNGIKVNGTKISKEKLLTDGDELAFGTSTARFVAS
ncbi:MAG: hypothetical protein RLZZ534_121 [Actinomycetota bacterium]